MALPDFFTAGHVPIAKRVLKNALAANGTITQPAGSILRRMYIRNNTANAVTGGIRVGTTAAGVDIHATMAVAASAMVVGTPLIPAYSATARSLYVEAVTGWNSASVDVVFDFEMIDEAVVA